MHVLLRRQAKSFSPFPFFFFFFSILFLEHDRINQFKQQASKHREIKSRVDVDKVIR